MFRLTEEQELIRKTAREFAREYCAPIAVEIDEEARWPEESVAAMAELGLPLE